MQGMKERVEKERSQRKTQGINQRSWSSKVAAT